MPTQTNVPTSSLPSGPSPLLGWLVVLVAIACLVIAPPSGLGLSTLVDWRDQQFFLQAANQTIESGLPDAETRSRVGPAYIALTLGIGQIFSLDAGAALVLLSRLAFAACAIILATVAMRQRLRTGIGFQAALALVAVLSLMTSVWYRVTDIPWTHFVATAILGAAVLVGLSALRLSVRSALIGLLAIALVQTRMFEAMVAAIAAVLILPIAAARNWQSFRNWPSTVLLQVALPFAGGAALGFAAIGLVSHNWSLYQQYSTQPVMVLTPQLAPTKALQLFWDPCYATLCDLARPPTVSPWIDSLESWRQPLLLQLPGLAGAAAGLLALLLMRPQLALRLPLSVLFAIVAAGGLILAYVSGAPSGSSHLKYGFFRDFVPALVLLTCSFIAAIATARASDGQTRASLVVPLLVFMGVVTVLTGLRAVGLPQVPGADIARFEVASRCEAGSCSFALGAFDSGGNEVPYPDLSYVTCNGTPLSPAVRSLSELRVDAVACPSIAVVPVASGLLDTPEDRAFLGKHLDLSLPADKVSVP